MKYLKVFLFMAGLASLVTGCASGPKYADYKASLASPAAGMGRIWFYRHEEFFGDGLTPPVKVDAQPVGHIYAGNFFTMETPAGVHKISATTETKHEISLNVSTNEDSYVDFYCVPGVMVGHIIPTQVDEVVAIKRLQKMTYKK